MYNKKNDKTRLSQVLRQKINEFTNNVFDKNGQIKISDKLNEYAINSIENITMKSFDFMTRLCNLCDTKSTDDINNLVNKYVKYIAKQSQINKLKDFENEYVQSQLELDEVYHKFSSKFNQIMDAGKLEVIWFEKLCDYLYKSGIIKIICEEDEFEDMNSLKNFIYNTKFYRRMEYDMNFWMINDKTSVTLALSMLYYGIIRTSKTVAILSSVNSHENPNLIWDPETIVKSFIEVILRIRLSMQSTYNALCKIASQKQNSLQKKIDRAFRHMTDYFREIHHYLHILNAQNEISAHQLMSPKEIAYKIMKITEISWRDYGEEIFEFVPFMHTNEYSMLLLFIHYNNFFTYIIIFLFIQRFFYLYNNFFIYIIIFLFIQQFFYLYNNFFIYIIIFLFI